MASAVIFVAQKTLEIETAKIDKCKSIFGDWHSLEDFEKCVSHVILAWSECRNNPYYSRFDAVHNKYSS